MTDKPYVPTTEEAERLIQSAHAIDELSRERGMSRRAVRDAIQLLEDAAHAHQHGRQAVVSEFLERAIERLKPHAADSEQCIHPGVFATGRMFEHCWTCNKDVPREEL